MILFNFLLLLLSSAPGITQKVNGLCEYRDHLIRVTEKGYKGRNARLAQGRNNKRTEEEETTQEQKSRNNRKAEDRNNRWKEEQKEGLADSN